MQNLRTKSGYVLPRSLLLLVIMTADINCTCTTCHLFPWILAITLWDGYRISPWTKTQGSSSDVLRATQLAANGAAWDSSSLPKAFIELTKKGMFQEGFRKGWRLSGRWPGTVRRPLTGAWLTRSVGSRLNPQTLFFSWGEKACVCSRVWEGRPGRVDESLRPLGFLFATRQKWAGCWHLDLGPVEGDWATWRREVVQVPARKSKWFPDECSSAWVILTMGNTVGSPG